jgi:hypothetical protein
VLFIDYALSHGVHLAIFAGDGGVLVQLIKWLTYISMYYQLSNSGWTAGTCFAYSTNRRRTDAEDTAQSTPATATKHHIDDLRCCGW